MDSIKCESPSPTRATSSVSAIAARGAHALSYGGGVLRFQTSWWAMQHVSWLRRPGITPTVVDDLVLLVGSVIVRFAPIWAAGLSLSLRLGWLIHGFVAFLSPFCSSGGVAGPRLGSLNPNLKTPQTGSLAEQRVVRLSIRYSFRLRPSPKPSAKWLLFGVTGTARNHLSPVHV